MPQKAEVGAVQSGEMETPRIMLLSEATEAYTDGELEDAIVVVIPDTGKARFNPSHEIKTGKSAGKMSKAVFIVAEIGSSFAGESIAYRQSQGDVEGLPLTMRLSITASAPNRDGKTVNEALNRPLELVAVPDQQELKTGTDN